VTTDNNNSHKNANSNRRRNKFTTNNNNNNNYVTQFAHDSSSFDSPWIIRSKMDTYKDEPVFDPEMYNVPERGYPKMTHLLDYATSAVELEIEKHDRILVQGMHFMANHDFHPLGQIIQQHSPHEKKNVCLNIYLCNRRVPYINS
jgi:hypothetical protein